ncbi:methyltransferase family protein [Phreatobacter sp. AB_2022a]|uniref:methyltransferase family protein n=1 Tax=Phreatobacter sp. AB_2022a TaxID=3003134 RepID=UPI002286E58C|nr:isoprenylcysteine carboxylmethyltransferase family protein [Phreatobacter sp. AB_2022a]MCZ0736614.1 isoprenylcysteine carboxylmethyltransferase family protein [Phreatobacter sp. AB_2022a]
MSGRNADNPGLPVLPPVLPAVTLLAAVALDWLPPHILAPAIGLNGQVLLGLALAAAGLWCAASAASLFRRAGTNIVPTQPTLTIVTGGPYRFTRNPMYLGMVLMVLGASLVFSLEWGIILTPVLWLALDRLIVAREEAYLAAKFGADYEALLARTRRWL